MLYPVNNKYRRAYPVQGLWEFRADRDDLGEQNAWFGGFENGLSIAVPGSWNEQLEEEGLLHFVGAGWYQRSVFIPDELRNHSVVLRVGSADYHAKVWVNGTAVGEHHLGFLPFEFDISDVVRYGEEALIVLRVDSRLDDETIPQGITAEHYANESRLREETFPPARFDFSPFGGIHRPVSILALPRTRISKVQAITTMEGTEGSLRLSVSSVGATCDVVEVVVKGGAEPVLGKGAMRGRTADVQLRIPNCRFWSPEDPFLYQVTVTLVAKEGIVDEYTLPVGVREVKIEGDLLLLNGKPIYLKGFGRHEDSAVAGKGLDLPTLVKDFGLMKWIHANSFRTSHYPYAEEVMALADKKGLLVIDEVPAVSLDFRYVTQTSLARHKEYVVRLMERDFNHPSVIMWSLGNEPNLVGEPSYYDGRGKKYWEEVFATAAAIDPRRPKIVPNCLRAGIYDPVLALSDIVAINRYYGWYEYPGQLECGVRKLEEEIDEFRARFKKPMLMTEFGVDALPGMHAVADQMFTEEYQTRYLEAYIRLLRSKPFIVGEHVWNFADFRTPQNFRRVFLNLKGVFTRSRAPKMAAFELRKMWADQDTP
jgi:beta-glucuronidase